MTTSIVVVNWNGMRFLQCFFDSLAAQTYNKKQYEVIMVDNNSSDQSVKFVSENFPKVILIKHHSNSGFAEGCNIGMRQAKGKYIVLINNDMELDKNWLKELAAVADSSSTKVGAVVSKVMFKHKPGYINNVGSMLSIESDWPVTDRGYLEKDRGQYNKPETVSAFCGASVLIKKDMLEDIGIFDQSFFMYFEDADLSWRGSISGWEYLYAPKSIALHEHTGSSKEGSPFFNFHVLRNRLLILLKHSSKPIFKSALRSTYKDWITEPLRILVREKQGRRAALVKLRLGIKILGSFFIRVPGALLKRKQVIRERTL